MKIISFSEDKNIEKRIAVTPDVAKKYLKINGKWQDHVLLSCINEKHN